MNTFMGGVLYWLLPGMIASVYLLWFFNFKVGEKVKKITLNDLLAGIGISAVGIVGGWVTVLMAIGMTWDDYDIGDIIVWKETKKKKKPEKLTDEELIATAESMGFQLKKKPLKPIKLKSKTA